MGLPSPYHACIPLSVRPPRGLPAEAGGGWEMLEASNYYMIIIYLLRSDEMIRKVDRFTNIFTNCHVLSKYKQSGVMDMVELIVDSLS